MIAVNCNHRGPISHGSCRIPTAPVAECVAFNARKLKPQSHRIVRLLDRTIGCDLANVRPFGNFATISRSGRILRSVNFAGGRSSYDWSYAWSRDQHRLEKIDDKIHHIEWNRTTSGSHKRSILRSIVTPDDRSYDQSWNSAWAIDWCCHQS